MKTSRRGSLINTPKSRETRTSGFDKVVYVYMYNYRLHLAIQIHIPVQGSSEVIRIY